MRQLFITTLVALLAAAGMAAERKPYTRNVAIVIYADAEPLDWTGPYEVYNDAASFGDLTGERAFHVYTVSKTKEPLSSQGLKVVPDYSIADAPTPDILVIPGGNSANVYDDPDFMAWAKTAAQNAEVAQSVCTGAFVLAKAGVLDKLEVTTWYSAIDALRETYPNVTVKEGRRFIDNGHVVTTAGISAGIDGSLHLVARLLGRRVADQVARYMEYHWTPESYLAANYVYLNPSTTDRGRVIQSADLARENQDFAGAARTYRALLAAEPGNASVWFALGRTLRSLDDHNGAAQAFARAGAGGKGHMAGWAFYNAAQEYARLNAADDAIQMLQKAWEAGYRERDALRRDPALANIREDVRFKSIVEAE